MKQATAHRGRRRTSTPHTGTPGHTRGHRAPSNNGGGPPRRLKPAPERGKDTNNPSPLIQSHTQPPGAAAQRAEPGPNPARRGAKPNVYIAHPTHGAGTWPHGTQPPTAPPKTTLNAGQCVRQPREGRERNRQPPPPKKTEGGGGGGLAKTAHSHQTAHQHHQRLPNPPPRRHRRQDPQGGHRGTTQPKPATPSREQRPTGKRDTETCRHTHRKKKEPAAQPERKGVGGQGQQGPGQGHAATDTTKQKKKSANNTP